jgi:hypothetical protein
MNPGTNLEYWNTGVLEIAITSNNPFIQYSITPKLHFVIFSS